jgi:hypothetical protein
MPLLCFLYLLAEVWRCSCILFHVCGPQRSSDGVCEGKDKRSERNHPVWTLVLVMISATDRTSE